MRTDVRPRREPTVSAVFIAFLCAGVFLWSGSLRMSSLAFAQSVAQSIACPTHSINWTNAGMVMIQGACTIPGDIALANTFLILSGGPVKIQGSVSLSGSATLLVENADLTFDQTAGGQREIIAADYSVFHLRNVQLRTNSTSSGNFYMGYTGKGYSSFIVENSTISLGDSWLLGNFFHSSRLSTFNSFAIPTEIYVSDGAEISTEGSSFATIWLTFIRATANIQLPNHTVSRRFDFSFGRNSPPGVASGINYQVTMQNSSGVLGIRSYPSSVLKVYGGANPPPEGELVIGYYIENTTKPVTISNLSSGSFIAYKKLSDQGRNLELFNVSLGSTAWQIYITNAQHPVTIRNAVLNELGVYGGTQVTVEGSLLQVGIIAAIAGSTVLTVRNSEIWSQSIQAISGASIVLQNNRIHGSYLQSDGCVGKCSILTVSNGELWGNGNGLPCSPKTSFSSGGIPTCNPFNASGAFPSVLTRGGGEVVYGSTTCPACDSQDGNGTYRAGIQFNLGPEPSPSVQISCTADGTTVSDQFTSYPHLSYGFSHGTTYTCTLDNGSSQVSVDVTTPVCR